MSIKKIIKEELEGFLDSKSGDWEWTEGEITLPPRNERRKIPTKQFMMETLGFQSEGNFEDWFEDPWDYDRRPGDPNISYGENLEFVIREYVLHPSYPNDKWEKVNDEIIDADIWESNRTTEYVFKNKQDNTYWSFEWTDYYDQEEWSEFLVEVFPYAQKIVFR